MAKNTSGAVGALGKLACLAVVAAVVSGPVAAHDVKRAQKAAQRGVVVTETVRFDWLQAPLARADRAEVEQMLKPIQVVARGSYVCSPAGFGRRSQCFAR